VERSPAAWFRNASQYLVEVDAERRKITWPTQKEYTGGTIGVLVIVGFITLVLGLMDLTLSQLVQWLVP
jgi:preprotein translocase SecE subunit